MLCVRRENKRSNDFYTVRMLNSSIEREHKIHSHTLYKIKRRRAISIGSEKHRANEQTHRRSEQKKKTTEQITQDFHSIVAHEYSVVCSLNERR